MNAELKEAFAHIKPVCDMLMVYPTADSITTFMSRMSELKKETVEGLQQYLLFPFITHMKSIEIEKKYEIQWKLADAMRIILEKVTVTSFEMCMKIETGLLHLIFDNTKPGMIADVPEELKHSVMKCMTVLMLNIDNKTRDKLLKTQVPLLAQAIFVSVHIAKLEKLRALRLAAINCVTAHTCTHAQLTKGYHITDPTLELVVVETLASILPGVLAALQDVAICSDNPGHGVVVAAIDAIHRILCVTLNDKHLIKKRDLSTDDFARMIKDKMAMKEKANTDVSSKDKMMKHVPRRSIEWYTMAGDKLLLITNSLVSLRTHEHYRVRKELSVYCARILFECNTTMQPSVPTALDTLITLSKDEYAEVGEYSRTAFNAYFANASDDTKTKTLDTLCDNFFITLCGLPRIMNNIDTSRKMSALDLVHGYIQVLCGSARPQRLTAALSAHDNTQWLCTALCETAALDAHLSLLTRHASRDVTCPPPSNSPWCKFRHLECGECEGRLRDVCRLLGAAECAQLVLDKLLEMFHHGRECELVYIMNWMADSAESTSSLLERILDTYIDESVCYSPLEVGPAEPPLTDEDTLDVTVYNPSAWTKESVPDLYEGAVETRYTDISYRTPRVPARARPDACATLAEAQRNVLRSCLLTEGVGVIARRLGAAYQPYLLKTLCLILERVGSEYEMLHLAGLKAVNDVAASCGHRSVADLIRHNADYFTNQVTVRLKKAWNCQAALQILSVVMEYSDATILDHLHGIVQDVLVQSCDKYYEKDLHAYLQVFLTFVECVRKWCLKPDEGNASDKEDELVDILKDVKAYITNEENEESLMDDDNIDGKIGKSAEEMYREDMQKKEEDILDYDDKVMDEKSPLPQQVTVVTVILRRCVNYVVFSDRRNAVLALQIMSQGLRSLEGHEDELLPMVHLAWMPLVSKFEEGDPAVMKRALDLLVTMAELSKDFIRSRAMKDVLPCIYKYLHKSSKDSHLKDAGSAYRSSQAYQLQVASLAALPRLAVHLAIQDEGLEDTMNCVVPYLSKKQPKPLQSLAVEFFKMILEYDYGAGWHYLRQLCDNERHMAPPSALVALRPVAGTPYQPMDVDYENNIKLIFEHTVS